MKFEDKLKWKKFYAIMFMLLNSQCWIPNAECQNLEHQFEWHWIFHLNPWNPQGCSTFAGTERKEQKLIYLGKPFFRKEQEIKISDAGN